MSVLCERCKAPGSEYLIPGLPYWCDHCVDKKNVPYSVVIPTNGLALWKDKPMEYNAEDFATKDQVSELRREIAELRGLIERLLEAKA